MVHQRKAPPSRPSVRRLKSTAPAVPTIEISEGMAEPVLEEDQTYLPRGAGHKQLRSIDFAQSADVHHFFLRNTHLRKRNETSRCVQDKSIQDNIATA